MVGEARFPFGKYSGKSIALVALTDYPYLAYICDKITTNSLRKEASRVLFALDNFEPQVECEAKCGQKATRFSIAYVDGAWEIDYPYWFCQKEECWNKIPGVGARCEEPIKYSSMLPYALNGPRQQSRKKIIEFQNFLNIAAGFKGVLNEQSAQKFIDDLVKKTKA